MYKIPVCPEQTEQTVQTVLTVQTEQTVQSGNTIFPIVETNLIHFAKFEGS